MNGSIDPPSITDDSGTVPPADLDAVLETLLDATGADAAEIFLAAPVGGEMYLAAHRGEASRAFRQITRFETGQGLPGLLAQTAQPLVSLDLPHDDRYLRSLVKERGFRAYLGVPMATQTGFLGSIHVAFRRRDDPGDQVLPMLAQAARDLARTLDLARFRAAEPVAALLLNPTADAAANLRRVADQGLATLIAAAGLEAGALLLVEAPAGTLNLLSQAGIPARLGRLLRRGWEVAQCPPILQRRCLVQTGAVPSDSALLRGVLGDLETVLWVPLVAGGRDLGVVLLGSHRREPLPARHLSLLPTAIRALAVKLHNAQVALYQEGRARRLILVGPPRDGETPAMLRAGGPGRQAPEDGGPVTGETFLDLHCLGQFEILRNGWPVPPQRFARRRSLELLKILLAHYGKPVHREELMEWLWPEVDLESAGTLLKVAVHYLRRALEPSAPPGEPSLFIRRSGDRYFFDTNSPHRLDSREFEEEADRAARLEREGRQAEALALYQRSIALYGGDFLEEELYSDWCAAERERLRERFLAVLRRAARLHLDRGETDAAVAYYQRILQSDGTQEDVHLALMDALWRAGRRDEALRQYRKCRAILARELDTVPSPEVEALRRRIAASPGPKPDKLV